MTAAVPPEPEPVSLVVRIIVLCTALLLAACQGVLDIDEKADAPIPRPLLAKMNAKGMTPASPIMLRIFKQENVLEVWKQTKSGRYALLADYEICKWSGKLGPKIKEGDRQAPEGFYQVARHQMNPRSSYHLSFNMGFPNAYDRAHGRTGLHLMVHGACSSAGCYSMTDESVQEIYALAREAHAGGQQAFQIQALPFRMTAKNMADHRTDPNYPFWQMLQDGYDHFEATGRPPKVDVCDKRYVFNTDSTGKYLAASACPQLTMPTSTAGALVKQRTAFMAAYAKRIGKDERAALAPVTQANLLPGIRVGTAKAADDVVATATPAANTSATTAAAATD